MPENVVCLFEKDSLLFCVDFSEAQVAGKPFELQAVTDKTAVVFDCKELLKKYEDLSQISIENIFDCKLAAYIFDPAVDCSSVEKCAAALLKENVDIENDAPFELLKKLYDFLAPAMLEKPVFRRIEMPLSPVLAAMEMRGISLDGKGLQEFGNTLDSEIKALEQAIYQAANKEFNINSTKQLNTLLFEELKL